MMILAALKKELLEISHDRTMLGVLVIFPVFVMVFMGSSFRSMEINGLPIGLAGPENIGESPLFSGLNDSQAFKLQGYASEEDAMTAFRNGQLRAIIMVPGDFEEALGRGSGSTIRIVVDNSDIALEQSVLAALSSVIEASSTDITRGYVSSAWEELRGLNESAGSLAANIALTRENMNATKQSLSGIRDGIDTLGVDSLEGSLEDASADIAVLGMQVSAQKAALEEAGDANAEMLNRTSSFLANASAALNESLATVQDTHDKLGTQVGSLNGTAAQLDASITGLEAVKAGVSDPVALAALDLNIASLESLHESTLSQIADAEGEMLQLEALNATLTEFGAGLEEYADEVADASDDAGRMEELSAAMDAASARIAGLNASFASARQDVAELKELLGRIKNATMQIDATLDDAMRQTASVDALIGSLQGTVAEQTGKDPETIASPLSLEVENQYDRGSFVDFIMPQVISVSLLFSCFLLGSMSLVREKTRKTIIRALMAPGALANLVAGKIATLVLLSLFQVAIILAVALLLFGVMPPSNIALLLWGTAISSLVLSSIGILVGFQARTESAAIQTCLLLAIPMLFLGNIIFSPDLLPAYTQILQQLLPLAHVTSIFKVVLITNGDPAGDVAALLSYFVLLAALMGLLIAKRNEISHYV